MILKRELVDAIAFEFLKKHGVNYLDGSLLPASDVAVDLGSLTNKFDHLYVGTVYADNVQQTGSPLNADTVDGIHAYATPTANALLALDSVSKFPISVYPSALLTDGTRQLTGNLSVSAGVTIDGVDISAHAADTTKHHSSMTADEHTQYVHTSNARTITAQHAFSPGAAQAPFTLGANAQGQTIIGLKADQLNKQVLAGNGLTGGGMLTTDRTLNVGAGTLLTVAADTVSLSNGTGQYQVPMTGATPFTPAWTNISTLAGNGLGFANDFFVNTGNGIQISSNAVAVKLNTTSGLVADANGLALADTVAGNGLTITSKVLAVGAGTLISVAADTVSLSNGTAQYQIPMTGLNPYTPAWTALSTLAGAGLGFTSGQFILTTSGTLTSTTTNLSTGSHTHAISASAAPGAAEYLLKTTPAGGLTLSALAVTGTQTIGQDLTVGANVLFVDQSQSGIGVNCAPDPQFSLDVNGNLRAQGWIVGKHAIQLSGAKLICHFDGPEPYATDFTGDPTGHMGQVATLYGGVIFPHGKFGKAVQLADSTTNLCTNPRFAGTGGYAVSTGGGTITIDSTRAYVGTQSLMLVSGTTTTQADVPSILLANGESIAVQARVYRETDFPARIALYNVDDAIWLGTYTPSQLNTWEKGTLTYTNNTGTSKNVRLYVRNLANDSTSVLWTDAWQVEKKAYPTPYCDGDMGTGHTWSGAASASTSTRTDSYLTYTLKDYDFSNTSVSFWFRTEHSCAKRGSPTRLLDIYNGTDRVTLYLSDHSGVDWLTVYSTKGPNNLSGANCCHSRGVASGDLHLQKWRSYSLFGWGAGNHRQLDCNPKPGRRYRLRGYLHCGRTVSGWLPG